MTDDHDHFTEAKLMKLFSARARGKVGTAIDVLRGAVELGKFFGQLLRDRKKPRRAEDIFGERLGVEEVRERGQMSVGHPEREDVP